MAIVSRQAERFAKVALISSENKKENSQNGDDSGSLPKQMNSKIIIAYLRKEGNLMLLNNTEKTNDEIIDLIRSDLDGSEKGLYLGQLYKQNYGFIHNICKKYSAYEEIEDLEQEAFFGLCKAVENYDPDRGSFLSCAAVWIKQTIRLHLEECGSIMRLPRYVKSMIFQYWQIVRKYHLQMNRDPDDDELIRDLKIDGAQLKRLKINAELLYHYSLDKVISVNDDNYTLGDTLADPEDHFEESIENMDSAILRDLIWKEVEILDADKAEVIKRRYRDQETLQAISDVMGITRDGVRKIEHTALKILRKSERINKYKDEYISQNTYSGTGFGTFKHTNTSVTERIAIELYDRSIEAQIRRIERLLER